MKIAIITVYNSPNFGSYWQARSLYEKLSELGHEVYLFDTKTRSIWDRIYKPLILSIVKCLLTLKSEKLNFQIKRWKAFSKNLNTPRIVSSIENLSDFDAVFFGSDEIWNVTRREMSNYPIFWGDGVNIKNKISYATSINNATVQDLKKYNADKYLKSFTAVSVRDEWTKSQIEQLCPSSNAQKVVDPTLLFDRIFYERNIRQLKSGYIALYYFSITEDEIAFLKELSKLTGKRIVSLGAWFDWCDECVVNEMPFSYYSNADYVVTNTFHGTAFAINFNKQFVSFTSQRRKMKELLNEFELSDRSGDGLNVSEVAQLLNQKIDWQITNRILDNHRKESLSFIANVLGGNDVCRKEP